jgi:cephalosporin hydroxylase
MLNKLRGIKQRLLRSNPTFAKEPWRDPSRRDQIIRDFHGLYYDSFRKGKTWADTWFLGTKTEKCPLDLWLYQELIYTLKPDVIVETGTRFGGSALFTACMCDLVGHGRIVTVDVDNEPQRPSHGRVKYIHGSSVDPAIVNQVRQECAGAKTVLVLLDSDHSKDHVLGELQALADLATVGSFVIVEDSNVNGHPVLPSFGPGPMEALDEFLKSDNRFVIDPFNEKFLLTFSPRGFLKRVK